MATPTAVVLDAVIVAASVGALWYGATTLVDAATRIARRLGLSELVIGLTVVALGTSAPEFAVTVEAALGGQSDIAVGNVVGSNLFNLGLVLGGVAMVADVPASRELVERDGVVLVGTAVAVLVFLADRAIGRLEGLVLAAALVAYLVFLARVGDTLESVPDASEFRRRDPVRLLLGLGLVVVGARLLVGSAGDLARLAGLSEWVIGATVVAGGTSTPELATSVVAARRGSAGVAAGNLVGSDLFNMLGVLGVAAVIAPMTVAPEAVGSAVWVFCLVLLAVVFLRTDFELSRREGVFLVLFAGVRWVVDVAGFVPLLGG